MQVDLGMLNKVIVLTAHTKVVANRGILKVQMSRSALVPARVLPPN